MSIVYKSFIHYLRHWKQTHPSEVAWWVIEPASDTMIYMLRTYTWSDIYDAVVAVKTLMETRTVTRGSRLLTCERNSLSWAVIDLACQSLGAVHIPIDSRLPMASRREIACQAKPDYLIATEPVDIGCVADMSIAVDVIALNPATMLGQRCISDLALPSAQNTKSDSDERLFGYVGSAEYSQSDIATILVTSGSQGAPKGVCLSYENLLSNARGKLDAMPQSAADRRMNILPFSHAYARTCELSTWLLTGSSMCCVANFEQLLYVSPRLQPTLFNGVPFLYEKLKQALLSIEKLSPDFNTSNFIGSQLNDSDLVRKTRKQNWNKLLGSSLRMLACGGAGLSSELFDWFANIELPIYQGYGTTEAGPVVASNRYPSPRRDSVGPPIIGTEVRLDDDQQLWVRGPGISPNYAFPDETSLRAMTNDGWLATGDLARWIKPMESDLAAESSAPSVADHIQIIGRIDDRITFSNGLKIDPAPIERQISKLLGITACILICEDSRTLTLLIPNGDSCLSVSDAKVVQFLREQLIDIAPSYAMPSSVVRLELPWTIDNRLLTLKQAPNRKRIHQLYLESRVYLESQSYLASRRSVEKALCDAEGDEQRPGGSTDRKDI